MGKRGDVDSGLVLFTREECHLCEVAAGVLAAEGLDWRTRNIDTDLELIRRYGDKVPVLFRTGDGAELFWPFDREDLGTFVGARP